MNNLWSIVTICTFIVTISKGIEGLEESPRRCCDINSVLIKMKPFCWNPTLNTTSLTILTCMKKAKISRFSIDSLGNLILPIKNLEPIARNSYCVANQTTLQDVGLQNLTKIAMLCGDEEDKIIDDSVTGYCMIVSIIFLTLTAAVYTALPEIRDLLGKSIISFCCTLALGMMVLVIMKLMTYTDMTLCAVRGFLAYFFVLSSFFWTNAISIQILLSISRPSKANRGLKDFLLYALYAWGTPAVLTLCMAVVNFVPGSHSRPGIGLNHCWFFNMKGQWYYMYSVMSILIIANICMFVYTSICLWRNTFAKSQLKALRYKFHMTVRLFVVMGVTWIFEMVGSWMEASILWVVIDIFNTLQGLMIFLVLVVFRRRVLKAMRKHGWLDCIIERVDSYLARGEDDEEDVIEHNESIPIDETVVNQ